MMAFNILNCVENEEDKEFLVKNCFHMFQKDDITKVTVEDVMRRLLIFRKEDDFFASILK